MGIIIAKNTKVIKATFKSESLKQLGTLVFMPAKCGSGWVALNDCKFTHARTNELEDSDICDIECFESYATYKAQETT